MNTDSQHLMEGTCGICKSEFVDPKILPCIHTFCKRCLLDSVRSANRSSAPFCCPLCKSPHALSKDKINALQDNYFVTTLPRPRSPSIPKNKLYGKQNHLRVLGGRRRPVSSVSRVDVTKSDMRKNRCSKHPSGSVYCKTCEIFQCLMCRNNKEHRGHLLIEADDIGNHFDSDEDVSDTDAIILSVLQQHHITGQTEEICQRAMHSIRDQASMLMEEINNRASEVIKKIEEEKLMLLKNLTLVEAQKLKTIRKALECADKVTKIQRNDIQKRQLPEIPTQDRQPYSSSPEDGSIAKDSALQLGSSLQSLGIRFVPYGTVRPVLGELNRIEEESTDESNKEVKLRHHDSEQRESKIPGYRHTMGALPPSQQLSHYNIVIGDHDGDGGDDTSREQPSLDVRKENEDHSSTVAHNSSDTVRPPQPAHRKLERLCPPRPVEHRPLPPTPAPRNFIRCGPTE